MGNVEEGEARCGAVGMDQEGGPRKWSAGGAGEPKKRGTAAKGQGEEYQHANVQRGCFN